MTPELQDGSENVIFLISQPRAGSTLLQQILGNHPDVHTTPETWIMLHSLYALKEGYETEYDSELSKMAVRDFLKALPAEENTYYEGVRKMHSYLYQLALDASGKKYFLDKTPRYYHVIPELRQTFPKAKFIILLRNPLAVLCSIASTWIKNDWDRLGQHKHDLITAPQLLVNGIEEEGEENCLVIQYEELLKKPESTIQALCERLNIEFTPEMLSYGTKNTHQSGLGYKDQKKDIYFTGKPNHQNLDRWIDNLENPQTWRLANDYLEILDPAIVEKMGYSYERLTQILIAQRPSAFSLWHTLPLTELTNNPNAKQHWKYRLLQVETSFRERGFSATLNRILKTLNNPNSHLHCYYQRN